MNLPTIFNGGCEDSASPRKVHLLDTDTGRPLCGQRFQHTGRVDTSTVLAEDFVGYEACSKCRKRLALAKHEPAESRLTSPP